MYGSNQAMKGFKEYIQQYGDISAESLVSLKANFKQIHLQKDDIFSKEGACAKHFGFLESGIVRAFIRSDDGKEYNKQFYFGPSIIGAYTSLLTKQPNRIIQQALTPCSVWVIEYAKIEALYTTSHEMERIGRKIAEFYYLEKERMIVDMALFDASQRYIKLKERFPNIEADIQQYHIASYLNITPTQLSRIRKKMKES